MRTVFLFVVASIILSSCVRMQQPVFNGIENVQFDKIEKGRPKLILFLGFFNPNASSARLKSADGEAWMDSSYLGHFVVDSGIEIPAKSNFSIPVKLDVEPRHLLQHSLAAFMNDQVLITIKGSARVGKSGLYKTIDLNYEGKQSLQQLIK